MNALAKVPVDHIASLDDIPAILVGLIADAPSPAIAAPWPVAVEDHVAGGDATGAEAVRLMAAGLPARERCPS